MTGCHRPSDEIIVNDSYYEFEQTTTTPVYINEPTRLPQLSADMTRDLVVETEHHIIQMVGNPGTQYKYYVWTGNTNTDVDPDVIVDRGTVMVNTDEE